MGTIDMTAELWAVAQLTDDHRKEAEIFAPFSSATLVDKRVKKDLSFTAVGNVGDAEKLPGCLAQLREGLAEGKKEIARETQRMPMLKPIVDFLNTVQIIEKPKQVRMTAQIRIDSPAGMLLAPLLMMSGRSVQAAPAAVRAAPVQPVQKQQVAPRR